MENSPNIIFNHIEIPQCPFLWNYENQFIHPVIKYMRVDLKQKLDDLLTNINNVQNVEKIKKFKKDYFQIEQKILLDKSIGENKINLAFHSWYFSKISKSNDMTKTEFNMPLETCIISES
jgi:hypothetical protein